MNIKKTQKMLLFISLSLFLILTGCFATNNSSEPNQNEQQPETITPKADQKATQNSEPEPEPEPEPYVTTANIIAVGDVMMHSPQIESGYDKESGTYHFDGFFSEVRAFIESGDWNIANLETPLAGEENRGFTGYPEFNAPDALADALVSGGFNIITNSNNHSLDRREAGVIRTLEVLRSRNLKVTGTAATAEEAEEILVVTKNEINLAVLAYTYGTNGIPVPQGKDYLVNLIDEQKIQADIEKARAQDVDLIAVAMHFGNEYQRMPSAEQIRLADLVIESGADIVLGSHPHVVQPYVWKTVTDEHGNERTGLIIYSMGNFISNQTEDYKDYGVIFKIEVQKSFPDQTVQLTAVEAVPTWVHRYNNEQGIRQYRVMPLPDTVEKQNDPLLDENIYPVLSNKLDELDEHLRSMLEVE